MFDGLPWLVVFDLDGTLIDSSLDLCLAVNAALDYVGLSPLPHPQIASYIGDGAATLMRRALGQASQGDASSSSQANEEPFVRSFPYFLDFYGQHKLDNTRVYEGVLSSLQILRNRAPSLPMAVLTNKPVRTSKQICAALELEPFFFQIYGGNSFMTKKPDPVGLLALAGEAAAQWRCTGRELNDADTGGILMVGDSATDVLTARRVGARSLGCRYGLAPESLEAVPPDLLCDHPEEWPAALEQFTRLPPMPRSSRSELL